VSASARPTGLLTLVACLLLALAVPASAYAQPSPLAGTPCAPTQVFKRVPGLECAKLDVPFDRADGAVGDIALAVQRVPASAPRQGVIVLLAGGPGQPALPPFELVLAPLARDPALRGFELVSFDQRGTGQSEGLMCPLPEDLLNLKGGLSAFIGACGEGLGATRTFYTSQESVEDLDALREALGGTPLSLFAVSYGGRVAGMYAREHPRGVARMVLDSPAPPRGLGPIDDERVRALRRVFDEGICGAGACRSFSSDVYADLERVVAKLHRHPLRTRIYDGHGRLRPASITEAGLLRLLSGLDLAPLTRELVPATITAAAHGNGAPLARLVGPALRKAIGGDLGLPPAEVAYPPMLPREWSGGTTLSQQPPITDEITSSTLFLATYCVENEMPWSPESSPAGRVATVRNWLAALPAGDTAPFAPATVAQVSNLRVCEGWPATPAAPPSPTGVSATPTLILSGDDDLRTPYEQDLTIAPGYDDVQLLRVPGVGHSTESTDPTGCAKAAMVEFLTTGQAPASCPGSREAQALPLPPASLADVPPASSRSPLAGRVASAATMTLEDLLGQTSFEGGGLRGGSWQLQPYGFALHGMVDVPGVVLSGHVHITGGISTAPQISGRLTVDGRLRGRLTLHGLTLQGRLGGALVHARLAAL
jgi:pimeloyl-ACP methyl ester carboxylesterase